MARILKQSTAFTFRAGPFLDSTDGVTAETGLTIGQADIQISKAGGAFAQTSAVPTTTHDTDGWYQCPLTTTDTNTLGTLTVQVTMSGALPVWEHFMVVNANVYDSLVSPGTDFLQVDVEQVDGDSTAAANLNSACDNYSVTRGLSGTALPAAAADAAGGLPISDAGALDLDAKLANTNEITAARMGALTDWINGGRLDLILDGILEDTGTTIPGTLTTIDNEIATIDGIVDNILTDTAVIGAAGAGLTAVPWNVAWDAEVQSECTDALNAYDPPTNAEMVARTLASADYSTAAALTTVDNEIATIDGIVDAILVDTSTTLEGHLTDIKGAGWTNENLTTIDANLDAVLVDTDTTIPGLVTTVDTAVDAIKVKTDSLAFTGSNVDANVKQINSVTVQGDGSATPWGPAA